MSSIPSNSSPTNRTVTTTLEMSPSRAFKEVVRRITWLNQRIEEKTSAGRSANCEVQEREALIWLMDKIKLQAEKILELKKKNQTDTHQNETPNNLPKRLLKKPLKAFKILSPDPNLLQGLEVAFDCEGFMGARCVADRSIGFTLTYESSIVLAELILREQKSRNDNDNFSLAE